MSIPILRTKLYIPTFRANLIHRPRLIELLNEGLEPDLSFGRRLILISAPAGFGKTSLISEWVAGLGSPVAWLSLDEGDSDPIRFLVYLISALQTLAPKIGERILIGLNSSQEPNEALLTDLLNEIAVIPERIVLVLDDYHLIDSAQVDQTLSFLIAHIPPNIRLVITTREDPSLPLALYRARGQLIELRAANLRFTPQEAGQFLNQVMKLSLSEENITALERRTEGWIAGLQLAALSMQGRQDIGSFIKGFTGSHRFVLDYLAEEVLKHQSERIRNFLLKTSILDSFNASLCNAVTESDDGKEILDILDHNNLFLNPLDDKRQWYRYHHLFAEVLQAQLMEACDEKVLVLHLLAGSWYEQNGLPADAIRHALAAKDFDHAADLIELAWPAAEDGSIQPATWLGWVNVLPEKIIQNRPVLNVCFAFALLGRGEIEAAENRLNETEQWLDQVNSNEIHSEISSKKLIIADIEQFKSLPETIAIGHAYIAQAMGNIKDTLKYTNQVLELVPEGYSFRRAQASMMLGMAYWANGDLVAADRVFTDYSKKLLKAGNITDAISTTMVLADIRLASGQLLEAIHTVEELIQSILDQGEQITPDRADLYRQLSELHFEQGNLESTKEYLLKSKDLGDKADLPVWRYRWCITKSRFNEALLNLDFALDCLTEAEHLYIRTPLPEVHSIDAMKARIWIKQGKLAKSMEWVSKQNFSIDDELVFLNEFEYVTFAKILMAQYQIDHLEDSIQSVVKLLARLLKTAEEGGWNRSVIEILVLQALAYQSKGNIPLAITHLERALNLAEQEGFIRIIVDADKPVLELLSFLESKDNNVHLKDFIIKLRSCFDRTLEVSERSNNLEQKKKSVSNLQSLVEPLSERELNVLKLLRTDLSGPEIARQCMVSLATIRTHTHSVYSKLGVNNRRAAVRRAEELELF